MKQDQSLHGAAEGGGTTGADAASSQRATGEADTEVRGPAAEAARHALRQTAQQGGSIGARIVSMARLAAALHMGEQTLRRADHRWARPEGDVALEPDAMETGVLARIGPDAPRAAPRDDGPDRPGSAA